jgi:hypothetical protein
VFTGGLPLERDPAARADFDLPGGRRVSCNIVLLPACRQRTTVFRRVVDPGRWKGLSREDEDERGGCGRLIRHGEALARA